MSRNNDKIIAELLTGKWNPMINAAVYFALSESIIIAKGLFRNRSHGLNTREDKIERRTFL